MSEAAAIVSDTGRSATVTWPGDALKRVEVMWVNGVRFERVAEEDSRRRGPAWGETEE